MLPGPYCVGSTQKRIQKTLSSQNELKKLFLQDIFLLRTMKLVNLIIKAVQSSIFACFLFGYCKFEADICCCFHHVPCNYPSPQKSVSRVLLRGGRVDAGFTRLKSYFTTEKSGHSNSANACSSLLSKHTTNFHLYLLHMVTTTGSPVMYGDIKDYWWIEETQIYFLYRRFHGGVFNVERH